MQGLVTALPASMPAMSIPQTGLPALSVPQAGMPIPGSMPFSGVLPSQPGMPVPSSLPFPGGLPPQPGMPVPGSLPNPGSLASQAVAVKQEPASQAQPVQVSMPMHIKMEPGLPVPGGMAMPVGPTAPAALFRPPPPVNTVYNLPSSIPMVPGGPAPVMPGASMAASIGGPAAQLPHVAHFQQHQLQQAQQPQAQQQQGRQRGPPVSGSLTTQTPYNVLFPPSSAVQPAAAQDPNASAGGLYDVLASITANTPGMLQPATSQAFSAPQLGSVSAPQLATAAQAAAVLVSQPQHSAAPVTGMQLGVMPPGGNAPTGAPVPYPVIQTGHLQQGMLQQQSTTRPQAVVQGPPHSLVMPASLPHSLAALGSAPHPYTAQGQGQAAVPKAPAANSLQSPQQQQQPVLPARVTTAAPNAAPSAAVTAPSVVVAPQSKIFLQQAPQPVASLAKQDGTDSVQQAPQTVGVPADIAQSQGNSSHPQKSPKAVPKQASQPAVVANAQPPTAPAPMSSPAKALAAAASPAPSAQQQKWAAAPTQPDQPPLVQQQAPKAAAATSAPSTQTQASAAAGVATAAASPQKAGPGIGTRSSSAMTPGRPQRATRSMAAKR